MSFTFDTNVAIYAFDPTDPLRHSIAAALIERVMLAGGPLPRQVCGEMLSVAHRRKIISTQLARDAVAIFERRLQTAAAQPDDLQTASLLAEKHRLQFWDALICVVARKAGVTTLLSEDMQDGLSIDGMTIINPFNPANDRIVEELLQKTQPR